MRRPTSLSGARASCPRTWPWRGLAGALGDQVALDLGEQREEGGHDFGLDVALAINADVLLHRHEGDACLGEGVEDGDDLTQRATEPGEFADDQTVAALEDVHQLVETAALFRSLSGGGRLDEIVDAEVVFAGVLEEARRWLRTSCCAVETLK